MQRRAHLVVAAVTVVLGSATAPEQASAGPTWQAPVPVSVQERDAYAAGARVVVDSDGDASVGWSLYRDLGQVGYTQVVSRPRRSLSWSEPLTLAEGGEPPLFAADGVGGTYAVYTKGDFDHSHVQFTYRGPDGAWRTPITLSRDSGAHADAIAVNAVGDVVVAWSRWTGSRYVIQAIARTGISGAWGAVFDLCDRGPSGVGVAVAIDVAGNALAVWVPWSLDEVQASYRSASSGNWEPTVRIAGPYPAGAYTRAPHLLFDRAGDATAAWRVGDTLATSTRSFGGSWSAPSPVGGPWRGKVELAGNASGDALVLGGAQPFVTQQPFSGAFRSSATNRWNPERLPRTAGAGDFALAMGGTGNAVMVWADSENAASVFASLRPARAGAWQPPVMLATTSTGFFSSVAVTIDGSDNAVAAWSTSREEGLISVADLRASGPVLAKVAIPTRARARASVRFSAEPAPWPAPLAGRPRWTFGDGGSAAGERVTHTYRRPGSYTVSVTQADASGAASSASAKIRVARVRAD